MQSSERQPLLRRRQTRTALAFAAVHAALLAVQCVNAGYTVLTAHALQQSGTAPLVFVLIRLAFAWVVVTPAALVVGWPKVLPGSVHDASRAVLCGLLGTTCNQLLFIIGMTCTSSVVASVFFQFQPVFSYLIGVVIGLEGFLWTRTVGVVLAISGAVVVLGFKDWSGNYAQGAVCLLLSALAMALYFIAQKPLVGHYNPLVVTAWVEFIGAISTAIASLYYVPWTVHWAHLHDGAWEVTLQDWLVLLYAVILTSAFNDGVMSTCNRHVSVTVLTIYGTLVPVLTTVFSVAFFGDDLYWRYLGAILVCLGLVLVVCQSKKPASLWRWQEICLWLLCNIRSSPDCPCGPDATVNGTPSLSINISPTTQDIA
eukprot:TRINITY_DN1375_c0_g1_i7.p1 TRINITY_DN1375_c0_g1~~TRINITY_DN1375_c0_g1_i7.p1  ORF type:complete len:390 (+),score=56.31 TRINITY_DN1375_c0_g1_i7:62-1171(+)